MHEQGIVVTLVAGLATALLFGLLTRRLGLSSILGYLLAGVALGPYTPGFVADQAVAAQLAELGVVLLMFGVGTEFHFRDLVAVRWVALPGALGQSAVATVLGTALALSFGWTLGAGLVLGIGLSVASTVVLVRGLVDHGRLDTPEGRVAVGWLVVEDVLTVVVLVLLPALAGIGDVAGSLGTAVGKMALLGGLVVLAGARPIPWLLTHVARTRSRELFTLTVLVIALAVATVSATVFGVSTALGAFLAGMVVGQSAVSHQAAADALPLRDAFAVLFFVSVGMLFDPGFVVEEPALMLGATAIVLVAKPLAAVAIVLLLGRPPRTGLTVAVGLAQIGEFSFILAEAGRRLGVLPAEGHSVLVGCALVSIALNPLLFRALDPIEAWLRRHPRLWDLLDRRARARGEAINRDVAAARAREAGDGAVDAVVVGHGPVGRTVVRILREFGLAPVVVDLNVDTVAFLERSGQAAVYGDASRAEVLRAAGLAQARYVVVTLPDLASRLPVVVAARDINPRATVLTRARYLAERSMLEEIGADAVAYEEAEAAVRLAELLLREVGADDARIDAEASAIRAELALRPERPAPLRGS
jgi:CPA2 family monovalent cation:H+ antiporter-2